jgi:monovalent cation/proton antiporter MnhG/PhaG subunit
MRLLLDGLTIIAVGAGALFFLAGTVGLLRFPDTLSRLHALTKQTISASALSCSGSFFRRKGCLRR